MPRHSRSVAIIGGGVGGLTAALALLRAGFAVTVYEQARALAEVGAGIMLAPNCSRILDRLGLTPVIEQVAVAAETFEFRRWDDARLISMTPLGQSIRDAFKFGYYQIHRADLLALLRNALPHGCVQVGCRCVDLAETGERVDIHFADGTKAQADLVIGADGVHSRVREIYLGAESARWTGNVAFRGLIPADRLAHLGLRRTCTLRMGPSGHMIHYFVSAGRLLNVVFLREETNWTRESWTDRGEISELRTGFAGWNHSVESIIGALDVTLKWALFDRRRFPAGVSAALRFLVMLATRCCLTWLKAPRRRSRTRERWRPALRLRTRMMFLRHCNGMKPFACPALPPFKPCHAPTRAGFISRMVPSNVPVMRQWHQVSAFRQPSTGYTVMTLRRWTSLKRHLYVDAFPTSHPS